MGTVHPACVYGYNLWMMRLATIAVLLAARPARADEGTQQPPPPTPFDRGRFGLSLGGSSQSSFGVQYFAVGAGMEYFVLDGVGLGVSGVLELGDGPTIGRLMPALRYVAKPLVGRSPLVPYVGVFYDHWFIGQNPDIDGIGARAGLLYVSHSLVLGLGVAVEEQVSKCTMDCTLVYPDLTLSLAL